VANDCRGVLMLKYKAQIIYDEKTIRKLDHVITRTEHPLRQVFWVLLAIFLIIYGVMNGIDTAYGFFLLLCGCILLPATKDIPSVMCSRILKTMRGKQLRVNYEFYPERFTVIVGGSRTDNDYESITKLVRSENYYFLFQGNKKACMISHESVIPRDERAFERYIESETGMAWTEVYKSLQQAIATRAVTKIRSLKMKRGVSNL